MDALFNVAVIWFGLGLAFFLLEFLVPGFILFFFGVGAWIVALVTLFAPISINFQLTLFAASSVLCVLFFRNWAKTRLGMYRLPRQLLEDEFIGKTGIAETPITPVANGKITFRGTSWDASSEDHIDAGENVMITGNQSIVLRVKSTKR
ncbi:MAG: NfeD family protein [Mucilaginibacter polytrichastri]|nr:NfeD family protein [Mucilaginibacter polytrichastri]